MAEIILTIVLEVVKCLAPPAYRQISYLRESKYTSNLQNLNTEVAKLKSERVSTEHQVDEAKRKGEEIEENVENWLATANSVIEEADKFTEDEATANKRCFKGLCPNLKTRPRLSEEAERQKEAAVKVLDARPVNSISYSIIPEDTLLMPNKDFEAFESRTSILNEIIDALKNPNVNMLLIYGMGGIGKTTLAKEVARKAECDKLFDQVVFSEVSESRDVRKIQGEIADKLGLKFDEESESGRARRLYDRLKKEKRILVILDNIWENLDLLDVGIPHGDDHMGCKVLFTARSEEVLSGEMESRKNFPVGFLKEDEAWSLFTKMAGDYVEGNELKEVARDVAKECAGLPVSIVTVARALRSKSIREWKDALEQLRRPSSSNFKDVQPAAYKAIELSYNKLKRDDLKNIFLLIGYTAISSIHDLLMCGMGLGLFQGVNKIEVARNRVHTLVRTLKASCMLLDHISQKKELFSMHDVVRDVAVSIASTERNVFTATISQVFPNLEKLKVDAKHVVTNKYLFSEDLLCKLKYLYVELVDERTILSLGDFLQRLHTMKVLQIGGYGAWLPEENVENGMRVEIREAKYQLEHILMEESSVTNNLVILRVIGCHHLVNLVPSSSSFQNLTNMVVSCCERLKIVLTSSIAKTLVRLRYMEIESCDKIAEIVLGDDVVAQDEVITFRELKELKLLHLKSLTSFCPGNCAFNFLSLERLVVDDCPSMKIFSEGKLSTPKLHKVQRLGEACWDWKDDLNTTIRKASLPGMVAGVWSDDSGLQLEATTQFSKLLSIERSPQIDKVIQSGVVPRFVEFLMREDYPQLQYEAAWALSNIASGTSENIKVVIDHGAVPIFVKLLASPNDDVREQAVWALGNVAGDSSGCRDLVLGEGALIPLLAELNEHAKLSMLRIAARTLSNLCKGKPEPPFDQVRAALPALAQLIHLDDEEVLSVCPRLVELLGHPSPSVLTPALRTIGNIVTGDEFQIQCIINCGALPYFWDMLVHNHGESIKNEVSWIISNITAGNREQIQAVSDAGLIGPIVNLLQNAEFDTEKEAAWAISNATKFGTHEQIKYLVREGCVKPLCDLLLCADPKIVTVCLEGLENILKVGVAEMNTGTAVGDFNQYAQLVEEAEGLEKIENLRSHDDNGISEKAVEILETYWSSRVIGRGR
ncbi:Importin subunit alpha-2 [Citrus sinensis]|uniref:Importin subunit alpha-2 n=1 Tax=Citrus sinensis TaxID=2711 RepID=A0ACB8KIE6_CITSI|nr:Importin subunit alpha-2 [Citrus sinensis]